MRLPPDRPEPAEAVTSLPSSPRAQSYYSACWPGEKTEMKSFSEVDKRQNQTLARLPIDLAALCERGPYAGDTPPWLAPRCTRGPPNLLCNPAPPLSPLTWLLVLEMGFTPQGRGPHGTSPASHTSLHFLLPRMSYPSPYAFIITPRPPLSSPGAHRLESWPGPF